MGWDLGKVVNCLGVLGVRSKDTTEGNLDISGGRYLKPPEKKLNTICSCHNFFPLSSVQIIIIPACCLLCVL